MSTTDLDIRPGWLAQVSIRLATRDDLPALEWEGAYTHFRRVYARAFERAERGEALLWFADRGDGYVLGQLFVMLKSDVDPQAADGRLRAFIHSFRVRPELRGRGLGTRLMLAAEADLLRRNFRWVYLHVARDNAAGLRLYERYGYRRISSVSGDWSYEDHLGKVRHIHEPGWRMAKQLKQSYG
ncbi:MAG: GNAT family N-acetyltransferase [Anaerolineales bacterium]